MGSRPGSFNGKDVKVTGLIFLAGLAVVGLEYTGEFLAAMDFGAYGKIATAVVPVAITAVIRWVRDNTPKG